MARSLLQDICDLYEVEKNTKEGRLNEYNKDITNGAVHKCQKAVVDSYGYWELVIKVSAGLVSEEH